MWCEVRLSCVSECGRTGEATPRLEGERRRGTDGSSRARTCETASATRQGGQWCRWHTADAAGLPLDEVTLAQNLADAGYFNAVMGKWQ